MGERAFEEDATDDDLAKMETELRTAMHAGAMGLTTSRSEAHETSDDRPVASRLATWDEVRRVGWAPGGTRAGRLPIPPPTARRAPAPHRRRHLPDHARSGRRIARSRRAPRLVRAHARPGPRFGCHLQPAGRTVIDGRCPLGLDRRNRQRRRSHLRAESQPRYLCAVLIR